ncbi:hypothetical protein [Mucilaginibacter terrae]|nr:hypothetical protein [Mucilaginibacter terrae]
MFSLKFAFSHFLHQHKAINRHGLHSPFVYRLVDEVIYDFSEKKVYADIEKKLSTGKKLDGTDKLLHRLIADAKAQNVWVLGKYQAVKQLVIDGSATALSLKNINKPEDWKDSTAPDVIYLDAKLNPQSAMDYFNKVIPRMQADTLLVVDNIHHNPLTKTTWGIMTSHVKVTASVNLFWLGLVYCRPGQVKEDFFIKF